MRKFQLKLNPKKCTLGITSGKLLGFVVSQGAVEVDPDKVKAILDLPSPRTLKEVKGILGCLNYIARFISQVKDKCRPLFMKHDPLRYLSSKPALIERISK